MAKLKTDTAAASTNAESATTQDETTTQTAAADGDNTTTSQPAEDKAPEQTPKADTPTKAEAKESKEESAEPDSYTLGILETFKGYESLYIDSQGSVFTVGTPERIRGGAKLYKNPYFKKQ